MFGAAGGMTNSGRTPAMSVYGIPLRTLSGEPATLGELAGKTTARRQRRIQMWPHAAVRGTRATAADLRRPRLLRRGLSRNQFAGQEPGTAEEIQTFCSITYGVSFPFQRRSRSTDRTGIRSTQSSPPPLMRTVTPGDIQWNFERIPDRTGRRSDQPVPAAHRARGSRDPDRCRASLPRHPGGRYSAGWSQRPDSIAR